ncbi:hypothetical protein [Pelagibacterium halotolerans]|uniref:DGQHR domain-containing protein n=1 Tax=Pelagibacterium halotolerans (strain DSM 22347 / JCM 15775 / CGMCC 1.7692 / B2) TaxID=1082931 RepID=G4R669_PELHB|nr:hypothetical protein [Pelagibacterium halotolerans]AEQ52162.1 hypothetical protein KKY_2153 [Pelagibacterium halotolerans B2]QJR18076.1 hypothetical protein HKM20_06275 [Pelagibacterium halotolerans]SDZ84782.1 hypothetical protein SAMN05428936_101223 [Pelagibacterium halotolerans]
MPALKSIDDRIDCISVLFEMNVGSYLNLVEKAYDDRGGLRNQRSPLKTTSARRIRQRMKDDISKGAVFPPVVIGVTVEDDLFQNVADIDVEKIEKKVLEIAVPERIAIIDGMQRTTALKEAVDEDAQASQRAIRVEFWISKSQDALVYRMLVLNAGQIPWDLKKQISVVFEPLIEEAKKNTRASRIIEYGQGRRFNPGEYSSSDIAEMYIAFSSRKTSVDTQEVLTDEFTKLDIVESLSKYDVRDLFFRSLDILIHMDEAFSSYKEEGDAIRTAGRAIFDKQTARVGLLVAIGMHVLGRAGAELSDEAGKKLEGVEGAVGNFCDKFSKMSNKEQAEFIKLDVLNELLVRRAGQVGRYERGLFLEAFRVLIEGDFKVSDMEVCWRAQM